jgi:hypothetical protein
MTEIIWMIVPYAVICGVVGSATYVMVEIFATVDSTSTDLPEETR